MKSLARASRWIWKLAWRAALVVSAILLASAMTLWMVTDVERSSFIHPTDSVTVEDRHGTPLRLTRPDGLDRRWVSLQRVSPHLIDAVLAVEDDRFYEHNGVDLWSVGRALLSLILPGRRLSGASTITQQVVKLVYGRPHGLGSKPGEIVRALRLEDELSKDEILEQYLNRLPYGDQIVGVARASEQYFGKPPSELTVSEAALLAGIPQAPSLTEPRRHLPRAMIRRRVVLTRMRDTGRIDQETYLEAMEEIPLIRSEEARPWQAPRFTDEALRRWLDGQLDQVDGRLRTSLDLPLQRRAESVLERAVDRLEDRGVTNGAGLVVSNATGEVLAYVGAARRGADQPGGALDLLEAPRQPGSTLKPFVYGLLFERGGTAATLLDDSSRYMTGRGREIFEARNYDRTERGAVRARVALASSLNLAALDASRRVGAVRIVARLGELGLSHLESPEHHGAAIVLGGVSVPPLELAGAYLTLARGGSRVPLSWGGRRRSDPRQIIDGPAARITIDILSDRRIRADAFGDDLSLLLEEEFGLKTGTSSGWRDVWAAAFTESFTVVVWLGDPSGRALGGVSGFEGAASPAVRILAEASARADVMGVEPHRGDPVHLTTSTICGVTGLLAGEDCGHVIHERFVPGTAPRRRCAGHDPDVLAALVEDDSRRASVLAGAPRPPRVADSPEAPRIVQPSPGARLLIEDIEGHTRIPLRARVDRRSSPQLEWEVDGQPLDTPWWSPTPGQHRIVAIWQGVRSQPSEVEVIALGGASL